MPPESDDPKWVQMSPGGASLMIQARDSIEADVPALAGREIDGAFACHVDVDDVTALQDRLTAAGETVVQEFREIATAYREARGLRWPIVRLPIP
jgi:hypothetical protein